MTLKFFEVVCSCKFVLQTMFLNFKTCECALCFASKMQKTKLCNVSKTQDLFFKRDLSNTIVK
jgi:hypothetical protein